MSAGVLVHEWLSPVGGSENVFGALASVFPDADMMCLWDDRGETYGGRRPRETWLARTQLRRHKALALPLMPIAWRRAPGAYDWILSSSHAFAHHVRFPASPGAVKLAYVHTPARYVWAPELDPRGAGLIARAGATPLRALDRMRAQEIDSIAVNSEYVRDRVRRSWGRDARVIHPVVEVERIQSVKSWVEGLQGSDAAIIEKLPPIFVLGASRWIGYKRLDLVIGAGAAAGVPVVIAGGGPDESRLRAVARDAPVPVVFVRDPSDALLYALYERAGVLVFPAVEDFGIVPAEALAAGTPVAVGPTGGAREVPDGGSGVLLDDFRPETLRRAVESAFTLSAQACRERARRFGRERFKASAREWVDEVVGGRSLPGRAA